jgi:hypothetical protein
MARPGGPKRGAGPNQYDRKTRCECDGPLPGGDGDCIKCGHWISLLGRPPVPSVLGDGAISTSARSAIVAGRTHRTSGPAIRI